MDFGLLFEMQVPKPWGPTTEADAYRNSVIQAVAAQVCGHREWLPGNEIRP